MFPHNDQTYLISVMTSLTFRQLALQVLNPCDICLNTSAPYNAGQQVALEVTDVIINISPQIIQMITQILSALSPKQVGRGRKITFSSVDILVVLLFSYFYRFAQKLEREDFPRHRKEKSLFLMVANFD